jgi:hypothetical protein
LILFDLQPDSSDFRVKGTVMSETASDMILADIAAALDSVARL